jgi:hypothetical protein
MPRLELGPQCVASVAAQKMESGEISLPEGTELPPCKNRLGNEACVATYIIQNGKLHKTGSEGVGCLALSNYIDIVGDL